ncbi:class I SAM-dependent methyltransferase [Streptomyces sp. NPDC048297]|uniref:class I SAM-dependent methyltransferase n=1 Tax=Streptomyces sp. NPDC048297 TaxID=3365531 RepID=UPI003724686F
MKDAAFNQLTHARRYFEAKSAVYDENARGWYGRLTDALLSQALDLSVFSRLPDGFRFLDVGGGAGRWTERIATANPESSGVLLDVSPGMVRHAERRATRCGYAHRVRHINGDVDEAGELLAGMTFDLIINTHHLLGFFHSPDLVLGSIVPLLTDHGLMVSVLPSRWHAAFGDLSVGDAERARRSLSGLSWEAHEAPYGHLFTPGEVRMLHTSSKLTVDLLTGFPCLIYPDPPGVASPSAESAEDFLRDDTFFREVLAMETELLIDPDAGARGANLFVVASRVQPAEA